MASEWATLLKECRECACFRGRRAVRAMTKAYDAALRPAGIRSTQFSMLGVIKAFGPLTSARLGEIMALEKTTLPRSVGILRRRGLIRSEAGRDRREKLLLVTPAGEAKLKQAYALWRSAQARVVDAVGLGALERIYEALERAARAAGGGER